MPVLHFEAEPRMEIEIAIAEGIVDSGVQLVNDDVVVLRQAGYKRIARLAAPIAAEN